MLVKSKNSLGLPTEVAGVAPAEATFVLNALDVVGKKKKALPGKELQLSRAKELRELTLNGGVRSPFHSNPGFFRRVLEAIKRFFRWIFRMKPPFPMDDLQLRYSMDLYRTMDERLFSSHKSPLATTTEDLPFSFIVDTWISFLSKQKKSKEGDAYIERLKVLRDYQVDIETIRDSKWSIRRSWVMRGLVGNITKRVENLKQGDSLYIPGGYLTYFKAPELFNGETPSTELLKARGNMIQMVYEVSKDAAGQLVFRACNLNPTATNGSGAEAESLDKFLIKQTEQFQEGLARTVADKVGVESSPVQETIIDQKLFLQHLRTLLEVQTVVHEAQHGGVSYSCKMFKEYWSSKEGAARDKVKGVVERAALNDASCVKAQRVYHAFKLKPTTVAESSVKAKFRRFPKNEKVMDVFTRMHFKQDTFVQRMGMKIGLLLDIHEKCKGELATHPEYREWLTNNVKSLLHALKAHFEPSKEVTDELKPLTDALVGILKDVQESSLKAKSVQPEAPGKQWKADVKFSDPVILPKTRNAMSDYQRTTFASGTTFKDLGKIDFSNAESALKTMKGWKTRISTLSDDEKIDELKVVLEEAYVVLQKAKNVGFWDTVPQNDLKAWTEFVNLLSRSSMQVQLGNNQKAPYPLEIYNILLGMYTAQVLVKRDPANKFDGYCLDTEYYHDILKNPHLDLGVYGPRIKILLGEMRGVKAQSKPVDLTHVVWTGVRGVEPINSTPNEDAYYRQFVKNISTHDYAKHQIDRSPLIPISQHFDGEGPLPAQVVHLRQMRVLSMVMMDRYRVIHLGGLWRRIRNGVSGLLEAHNKDDKNLEGIKKDFPQIYRLKTCKDVDDALDTRKAPSGFTVNVHIFPCQPTLCIKSLGVYFHPRSEGHFFFNTSSTITKSIPSPYAETGVNTNNQEIRENIFKGGVVNSTEVTAGEDGYGLLYTDRKRTLDEDMVAPTAVNNNFIANYIPTGVQDCELGIVESTAHLPGQSYDIFAEMRLIQTDSESDRIEKTMALFEGHPSMLSDKDYGFQWKQLIRLNLFRNASLFQHLCKKPAYAQVLIKSLNIQATAAEAIHEVDTELFLMNLKAEILDALKLAKVQSTANLDESIKSLQRDCDADFIKLQSWLEKAENPVETNLFVHRQAIHQAFLQQAYYQLMGNFDRPECDAIVKKFGLWNILKSYFFFRQHPLPENRKDKNAERMIHDLYQRLMPQFNAMLKNKDEANARLSSLVGKKGLAWKEKYPCFTSGKYLIDLQEGRLYIDGKTKGSIPDYVARESTVQELFGKEILEKEAVIILIELGDDKNGVMYSFHHNGARYRIVSQPDKAPILYKRMGNSGWFELQSVEMLGTTGLLDKLKHSIKEVGNKDPLGLLSGSVALEKIEKDVKERNTPFNISEGYFWINGKGNTFIVEDSEGKRHYKGYLSTWVDSDWVKGMAGLKKSLAYVTDMSVVHHGEEHNVLNVWDNATFVQFRNLADDKKMIALGKGKKVERVAYTDMPLEYRWDYKKNEWGCVTHPGYRLSSKRVEDLLNISLSETNPYRFFPSSFTHFHVLEKDNAPAKLILAGEEYASYYMTDGNLDNAKYHEVIKPVRTAEQPPALFSYQIDPSTGIKSDSAEGYLYLAYVLFTQSKYAEAVYYLKKARDIKPGENVTEMMKWFDNCPKKSAKAQAVRLHLKFIQVEQDLLLNKSLESNSDSQKLVREMTDLFLEYNNNIDRNKIPPELQLKVSEEISLQQYFENRSNEFVKGLGIDNKGIGKFLRSMGIGENVFFAFKGQLDKAISTLKKHEEKLRSEIEMLEIALSVDVPVVEASAVQQTAAVPAAYAEMLFPQIAEHLKPAAGKGAAGVTEAQVSAFKDEVMRLVPEGDGYLKQMMEELATDTADAHKKVEAAQKTINSEKIDTIKALIQGSYKASHDGAKKLKGEILESFTIASVDVNAWQNLHHILHERDRQKDIFFTTALYCYGADEWSALIDKKVIKESDIEGLKGKIEEFLRNATLARQASTALRLLDQYAVDRNEIIHNQLVEALNVNRFYDIINHPYRRAISLLEFELGIILRESQINNIVDMMKEPNSFKHEALAGGKTTVLRNAISKLKADGKYLSGVITYEPLLEMHHPIFEKTAKESYGDMVFLFRFSRQDKTDIATLTNLYRNLLRTVFDRGRIDTTKKDLLSFHHAIILKYEELMKFEKDPSQITPQMREEFALLDKILLLLEKRARFGNDELDQVSNPEKEHNYALRVDGQLIPLDQIKMDAALEILQWIKADGFYSNIFSKNLQYTLRVEEKGRTVTAQDPRCLLRFLAGKVCEDYGILPADHEAAIAYFTGFDKDYNEASAEDCNAFFKNVVVKHKDHLKLRAFHKYLQRSMIVWGSLNKRGGEKFARSADGILVKPCEKNGKPSERSEHGTEEETIWYHCLNYMDTTLGGVSELQIKQLVNDEQGKALKAIKYARMIDPNATITFQNTPEAQRFLAEFGIKLQLVTESDYPRIAEKLNSNPKALADFLKSRVFSQIKQAEEKIVGNTQDMSEMIHEFYGASGTSDSYRALPDKVKKSEARMVKQPGVDGAVVLSMLKEYKKGHIHVLNDTKTIAQQVAAKVATDKHCSVIIDLAASFPGKNADQIVAAVAQHTGKTRPIRFVDDNDHVMMRDPITGVVSKYDNNRATTNMITILDKAHTRGTDIVQEVDTIGWITIGPNTKKEEFFQAYMRLRKAGKGQEPRYLLESSAAKLIEGEITFEKLLLFVENNEKKGLQPFHLKGEKQKIKAIPKTKIFASLPTIGRLEDRMKIWDNVRSYFIQGTQEKIDAMGAPLREESSIELLMNRASGEMDRLTDILSIPIVATPAFGTFRMGLEVAHKKLEDKLVITSEGGTLMDVEYLPAKSFDCANDLEQEQEVEQEQEQEVEVEVEQEQEQEQELEKSGQIKYAGWVDVLSKGGNLRSIWDDPSPSSGFFIGARAYNKYHGIFPANGAKGAVEGVSPAFYSENIFYTRNIAYPETNRFISGVCAKKPWGAEAEKEKLTPHQQRMIRVPILVDRNKVTSDPKNAVKCIFATTLDMDHTFMKLDVENTGDVDLYLYSFDSNDLYGQNTKWKAYPRAVQREIVKALVQAKFFAGEINLLDATMQEAPIYRKEKQVFADWLYDIKEKFGLQQVRLMEINLKKYLQAMRPSIDIGKDYTNSPMRQAFKQVMTTDRPAPAGEDVAEASSSSSSWSYLNPLSYYQDNIALK